MNEKKSLLLLGGTRGLGKGLVPGLSRDFNVVAAGSKDVDVQSDNSVANFFASYTPDILVYLAVFNLDSVLHKLEMGETKKQVEVSCLGLLRTLRVILPAMRSKGFGRIVLISSILKDHPVKGTGIYAAGKAFGENIIRMVALENAKSGITANSLQLGYFDGGLMDKIEDPFRGEIIASIPLGRLGRIEEMEYTLRFIIGNSYLTGATITLAGGLEAK